MPNNCAECPNMIQSSSDDPFVPSWVRNECSLSEYRDVGYCKSKPDWCPLGTTNKEVTKRIKDFHPCRSQRL